MKYQFHISIELPPGVTLSEMKAINGEILDDGVDEPWLCPHCGLNEELCDCDETAAPMEDRWDYDHGPDHMREVIEDSLANADVDARRDRTPNPSDG